MKKIFLMTLTVLAMSLMACSGNAKTRESEELPVAAPAKDSASEDNFKIENGRIFPINNRPLIVDFSATWCPPCRQLKPIFHELEEEYKGKIDFATIDVDQYPELSAAYNVQSIPCIIYVNSEGVELGRTIGFQEKDQLKADLSQQFNL